MKDQYVISDFSKEVLEKDRLCEKRLPDRWETVSYETAEISGKLLVASETSNPLPVTVSPALTGWHRIYVCTLNMSGADRIDLKLTGDEFSSSVAAGKIGRYVMWAPTEKAEESFWKCADMTGRSVEISKTVTGIPYSSNLVWLRFEPMSDREVQDHLRRTQDLAAKTMFAHMDGDFHGRDCAQTADDYCRALYAMKDSDVGIVCQEVTNDLVDYSVFDEPYVPRQAATAVRMEYCRRLSENRETVYPKEISRAHSHGMKLFAGHRMQLSCFAFPHEQPLFTIPFVQQHPELRCKARDGRWIDFLSYGHAETQDFMIETILESARHGFDGVHLIFNRGMHLGFEEPVAQRYRLRYGNTDDFYRLPQKHPKMTAVRTEIMAEFLAKLRKALAEYADKHQKEPLKIFITAYYSAQDSLIDGLDIEYFSKNGLIDGFVQTKMRVWEEYEDVLADDGLIDVEQYAQKAENDYIIRREHDSNMTPILSGIPCYREISDRYGVAFYSEIQWENALPPEEYVKAAKAVYAAGAKAVALWDCYPARVCNLAEWHATARLGRPEEVADLSESAHAYHKIVKVLAYNGKDIRYYNPSWRG